MTIDPKGLSLDDKRALLRRLLTEKRPNPPDRFPLTVGQRSLLFLNQLYPESGAYQLGVCFRLRPRVDLQILPAVLTELMDQHPALRTVFEWKGHESPVQRVLPHPPVPLTVRQSTAPATSELPDAAASELQRPLDIEQAPFRVVVWQSVDGIGDVVLLVIHHLISDAWSLAILTRELRTRYAARLAGVPHGIPTPTAIYHDFVVEEQRLLHGEDGKRMSTFWTGELAGGISPFRLPDHTRLGPPDLTGRSVRFDLTRAEIGPLNEVAARSQATLFAIFLAALHVLLRHRTDRSDTVVGVPFSGRIKPEWRTTVGYFVNILPFRIPAPLDQTFRQYLHHVRDRIQGALTHQAYPFHSIVEDLALPRDGASSPVFQVTLNLVPRADRLLLLSGATQDQAGTEAAQLDVDVYQVPMQEGAFDLGVELFETESGVTGFWKYATSALEPTQARDLLYGFRSLLRAIAANPDATIANLRGPALENEPREEFLL